MEDGDDGALAEFCEIVLVGSPDLLDEAMSAQALEQAGDLRCGAMRKVLSQVGGAQAGDGLARQSS